MSEVASTSATATGPVFPRIERQSLRATATTVLKARIASGDLAVGRLYAIGDIAEQMGVSPTPVREALLDLKSHGLIEMVRNRGFRVVELDEHALADIVDVRLMLEPPAMARLATLVPAPDLSGPRELSVRIEQAVIAGEIVEFLTLDKDFHLTLTAGLGNGSLSRVVEQLRDQTRLLGLGRLAGSEELVRSAREHGALLDAIEARDAAEAERVMTTHLRHIGGLWSGHREAESE